MRCLSYEGGRFVEGIAVTKWVAKWLDRATKELKTGTEKIVVAVGLDGGPGSASRQQRLSLCDRWAPEVKDGYIFEAHPAEIPKQGEHPAFKVLRKVGEERRWDHGTLVRVATRIEFQAPTGTPVKPWGGKVELVAHGNGSTMLVSGTVGPWDDALVVLYPGDVIKVTAGIGLPSETAIMNDLHRGVVAIPWSEHEAQQSAKAKTPAVPPKPPEKKEVAAADAAREYHLDLPRTESGT